MHDFQGSLTPTPFGSLVLIWRPELFPQVCYIHQAPTRKDGDEWLRTFGATLKQPPPLAEKIRRHFSGEKVNYSLDELDPFFVPAFQRQVYETTFKIPRGKVWTYGTLAKKSGRPRAARAVGNAMAGNPFPFIIPCHHVVRAGGLLGNYGAGPEIKRRLLEMEGVKFIDAEKIDPSCWK